MPLNQIDSSIATKYYAKFDLLEHFAKDLTSNPQLPEKDYGSRYIIEGQLLIADLLMDILSELQGHKRLNVIMLEELKSHKNDPE